MRSFSILTLEAKSPLYRLPENVIWVEIWVQLTASTGRAAVAVQDRAVGTSFNAHRKWTNGLIWNIDTKRDWTRNKAIHGQQKLRKICKAIWPCDKSCDTSCDTSCDRQTWDLPRFKVKAELTAQTAAAAASNTNSFIIKQVLTSAGFVQPLNTTSSTIN